MNPLLEPLARFIPELEGWELLGFLNLGIVYIHPDYGRVIVDWERTICVGPVR